MVTAPDGKSYIVKIGTKMGKNNGVVVKILNDRIEIKESFYDFTGEVRTGIQTIQLPEREGV
jgi:type IV pilus assembly protein PilP